MKTVAISCDKCGLSVKPLDERFYKRLNSFARGIPVSSDSPCKRNFCTTNQGGQSKMTAPPYLQYNSETLDLSIPASGCIDLHPFQIVSLYDVLKAYGHLFYLISSILTGMPSSISMVQNPNIPIPDEIKERRLKNLSKVREACFDVDLPVSFKSIEWAEKELAADNVTYKKLAEVYEELGRCISHELSSIQFFHVPPSRAVYYQQKKESEAAKYQLLTAKGKKKFPKSIEDAEEAAKCIALSRYTASVFHLMRVMERGVQRLGKKLAVSIPVEEKDWGVISNHINGALRKLPNSTPKEKRIHAQYAKAAVYLDNVRESWRNPTMHPKETYTEEEAENAFRFVKQYMEYLAKIL